MLRQISNPARGKRLSRALKMMDIESPEIRQRGGQLWMMPYRCGGLWRSFHAVDGHSTGDADAVPDADGSEAAALQRIRSACEATVQQLDSIPLTADAEQSESKHELSELSEDESEADDRFGVVTGWSNGMLMVEWPFQIQLRDLQGKHRTIDGVRSGELVSVLLAAAVAGAAGVRA